MKTVILGLEGLCPDPERGGGPPPTLEALRDEGLSGALDPCGARTSAHFWWALGAGRLAADPESPAPEAGEPTAAPMLWDLLGAGAGGPIVVGVPGSETSPEAEPPGRHPDAPDVRARFLAFRRSLAGRPWDCALLVDRRAGSGGLEALGAELEETFALLSGLREEVLVILVFVDGFEAEGGEAGPIGGPRAGFLMLSSLGSIRGTVEGVRLIDLAPTILHLAGKPVPATMSGRPLPLDRLDRESAEDDRAVEDRLRGLGYLA